jgi:hypothetical protein
MTHFLPPATAGITCPNMLSTLSSWCLRSVSLLSGYSRGRTSLSSPSSWVRFLMHRLNIAGYLGVAYITRATQGIYVYSFLNPNKGAIVAAYIFGIFAGAIIIFSIVNCIAYGLKKVAQAKSATSRPTTFAKAQSSLEKGTQRKL